MQQAVLFFIVAILLGGIEAEASGQLLLFSFACSKAAGAFRGTHFLSHPVVA